MHDEGIWVQLAQDVGNRLNNQESSEVIPDSDDDTSDDEDDEPAPGDSVALKADNFNENTSGHTGYYQCAIGGFLSLLVYSTSIKFNKKGEKVVSAEEPFLRHDDENHSSQMA